MWGVIFMWRTQKDLVMAGDKYGDLMARYARIIALSSLAPLHAMSLGDYLCLYNTL